ncbi:hypothetical protein ABW19_dt0206384 [Dactylella cylindrospora]|nr:hypothetical protein ABW19_dt0206384 [Dactylella cylindrospora]
MRLSKVNLIKKSGHGTGFGRDIILSTPSSDKKHVIGSFWYIREELTDDEARKLARAKQADGYRGDIFYGSAEKIWKKMLGRREIRSSSTDRGEPIKETDGITSEDFNGRSYGLLSDDEEDEEMDGAGPASFSQTQGSQTTSVHQSFFSSPNKRDLLSPPLSPNASQESTPVATQRTRNEDTPPMPGSFIFEDEAPASPAFSSGLTEPIQSISDILYATPSRPTYINPGLALEIRFDTSSPVPPNSRFDMTPRQLAAFSRRRQEFEKLMERPTTPSVLSDAGVDDFSLSDKDRAERERRRKDLQKFRLEREKRLRLENHSLKSTDLENSRKRSRDSSEAMDVDPDIGESAPKKSRSSEIFAKALGFSQSDRASLKGDTSEIDPPGNADDAHICSPSLSDVGQPTLNNSEEAPPSLAVPEQSSSSYSAPTPSPSPPLRPDFTSSKHNQPHIPKIPSGLRNTTNLSSSPATSPLKHGPSSKQIASRGISHDNENRTRAAVDSVNKINFTRY